MNTNNVAIVARLKAAGLLDIAERAAKREELKFAHCIEPGEVRNVVCLDAEYVG